ncbi:hypothetical protein CAI21_19380 [Alkalilimnicola ehrlichii]|uniref:Ig-like domain-containing protein n=1 Tax=Alkalilimnicola ehrlichii TaxID=351052 RepID=UPI000E2F45DF|nr:Ig-like domain-containing protein [Alkalilimnicola ehrlichii]RFA25347.1 hypothetical protein CAI21_19380 [Alkalilimnicola ehrlichii]
MLSESGLYRFYSEHGGLVRQALVALPGQDGFHIAGERLLSWAGETLRFARLDTEGHLAETATVAAGGPVYQARADGELVWLQVDGPYADNTWQVYRDAELVGLWRNGASELQFAGDALYERVVSAERTELRRRQLRASAEDTPFEPQLTELAQGVLISGVADSASLGGSEVQFTDAAGRVLPAAPHWDGERQWFLPRAALTGGELRVLRRDRAGQQVEISLSYLSSGYTAIDTVRPDTGTTLTAGAVVPVQVSLDEAARIRRLELGQGTLARPFSASVDGGAAQWLALDEAVGSQAFELRVNGSVERSIDLSLAANDPERDEVLLLQPQHNRGFIAGEAITVEYRASERGEPFRHAEISLYDFNRNLLGRVYSARAAGQLALRAPAVSEQDNLFVRVRAYYGEQYRYSESEVGIRVFPELQQPSFTLEGVQPQVLVGSYQHLRISGELAADAVASLVVRAEDGSTLFAGERELEFTVPEAVDSLRVVASVADPYGNRSEIKRDIRVVDTLGVQRLGQTRSFDLALPDVGDAVFISGRQLRDLDGALLATLEAPVTAVAPLGERLLVAQQGIGLVVLDPTDDYRVLSTQPLSQPVTALAAVDERVLAVIGRELTGFEVAGNALEPVANLSLSGPVLDIQAADGGFVVLSRLQVARLAADFSIRHTRSGEFSAMASHGDLLYVASPQGRLHVLTPDFNEQRFELGVAADRLLRLQGQLLALSAREQSVQIIDVASGRQPLLVGTYPLILGERVDGAVLIGGRVWIGGATGTVLGLDFAAGESRALFEPERQRGLIRDVAVAHGAVTLGADHYGAIRLDRDAAGGWQSRVYPAAYTEASQGVAAALDTRYLVQPGHARVIGLDRVERAFEVFGGGAYRHIALTQDYVVASRGSTLYFADRHEPSRRDSLELETGDAIESLVAVQERVFVGTVNGRVHSVRPGGLPLVDAVVEVNNLLNAASPIRLLASDGDHLFYALDNVVYRLRLVDMTDSVMRFDGPITALHYAQGRLWIATGEQVQALDPIQWRLLDYTIDFDASVTALAAEDGWLVGGKGGFGFELRELPAAWLSANPALAAPAPNTVFSQGEHIRFALEDSRGVNAVRYYLDGELVARSSQAPFSARVPVLASLRNGFPFELHSEIETVTGEVLRSAPRRVLLQGEELPANPFSVSVELENFYLPRPLRMQAHVHNSTQPVQQVEFYASASPNGPFEILGRHYGPEYIIERNFDLSHSGHYIRVRAVDIYGNYVESSAQSFPRLLDPFPPNATISVDGPMIDGRLAAGHPFTVNVELDDSQSGIDYALLSRDGLIVAAAFDAGVFSYQEAPAQAGATLNYSVIVVDNAGNERQVAASFAIVEDNPPSLDAIEAPEQVREQSRFPVRISASDAVALREVRVHWHGETFRRSYDNAPRTVTASFDILDSRALRLDTAHTQTLLVEVEDSRGQVVSDTVEITVVPDSPPDASQLVVDVPGSAFFNSLLRVSVGNLWAVDDGARLELAAIDHSSPTPQIAYRRSLTQDSVNFSLSTPRDGRHGDEMRFSLRVTDELGQVDETEPFSIVLTQRPNAIEFYRGGDADLNRSFATVGEPLPLQVRVLDSAGRYVPAQSVRWVLQRLDGSLDDVELGVSETNAAGLASLDMDTVRTSGQYRVRAEVIPYGSTVNTAHPLQILPGPASGVLVSHIPPLEAGQAFGFALEAVDEAGNAATGVGEVKVLAEVVAPSFHFGFADHVRTEPLVGDEGHAGERAVITLRQGRAEVSATASRMVGDYSMQLQAVGGDSFEFRYDHDGNPNTLPETVDAVPLRVLARAPSQLLFELAEIDSQEPLGRPDVLEAGDTAHMQLSLVDDFGNRVSTLRNADNSRRDADFSAALRVTGSAQLNGLGNEATVDLVRGRASFPVSNEAVEEVLLSVEQLQPELADLPLNAEYRLDFAKRPPAIGAAAFSQPHDSTEPTLLFTYTEPVIAERNGQPVRLYLDDAPVYGHARVDETTVEFVFQGFELNRCYRYSTADSNLIGLAEEDAVLVQEGEICGPQVALPQQGNGYALEQTSLTLALEFGDGIDRSAISNGRVLIDEVEHPFDWSEGEITLPRHTDTGVDDGTPVRIELSGLYQGEPLRVANTLSIRILQRDGDYDGDGLPNWLEYEMGYDPTLADTSGNGINDGDEDYSGNGLTNLQELHYGTNPLLWDTSGNGISDYDEIYVYGTDPLKLDTDGDGLPDDLEIYLGSDPTDPNSIADISDYVVGLTVTPTESRVFLSNNTGPIQLSVEAQVRANDKDYVIDVTEDRFGAEFAVSEPAVAQYQADGSFIVVGHGEAELLVSLGQHTAVSVLHVDEGTDAGVRLMPLDPPQVLYRNADHARLWLEISGSEPTEVECAWLDGKELQLAWRAECYFQYFYEGSVGSVPQALQLVLPDGVPNDADGTLTVSTYGLLDGVTEEFQIQVPVVDAPLPVIDVAPELGDRIELRVGEALDIPLEISGGAKNRVWIEYLIDGEPLVPELRYPALDVGEPVSGRFNTVTSSSQWNAHGLSNVHWYSIRVEEAGVFEIEMDTELSLLLFEDTGEPVAEDLVYAWSRDPWFTADKLPLSQGRYLLAVVPAEADVSEVLTGTVRCTRCQPQSYTLVLRPCTDGHYGYGYVRTCSIEDVDGGWGNGGSNLNAAQAFHPVQHKDRSVRYKAERNIVRFGADQVGERQLTLRLREAQAGGAERVLDDVASFTVNVMPSDCGTPQAEVKYPLEEGPIYLSEGNVRPVRFSADAPSGVSALTWLNRPSNLAEDSYRLVRREGSDYVLLPRFRDAWSWLVSDEGAVAASESTSFDALASDAPGDAYFDSYRVYEAIANAGLSELKFGIESVCGAYAELTVPLTVREAPAPEVSLLDMPAEMNLSTGQMFSVSSEVIDSGRSAKHIGLVFSPEDTEQAWSQVAENLQRMTAPATSWTGWGSRPAVSARLGEGGLLGWHSWRSMVPRYELLNQYAAVPGGIY